MAHCFLWPKKAKGPAFTYMGFQKVDHSSPRSVQTFMCDILLLRRELDVLKGTGLAGSVYKIVPFPLIFYQKRLLVIQVIFM